MEVIKRLSKLHNRGGADGLTTEEIASLLTLDDFSPVYQLADDIRREHVGDVVHLRAIIEFSNVCKRQCIYCGLNRENKDLPRFRMSHGEILETAEEAVKVGYRTIVLQSGEDDYFTAERLGAIVEDIKKLELLDGGGAGAVRHPAITLSCGEMSRADYQYLQSKSADRYLLKHETADADLYNKLHPCGTLEQRVGCLRDLRQLGYETGSGFMIGLPGQTPQTIAKDLLLLKEIPCKMAGIGPFISNPKTPLAGAKNGDPELTRRAVALARILLPEANLPLTTSLSILSEKEAGSPAVEPTPKTADRVAWENPFAFGANVIMKKVTPDKYKEAYEIYPARFKKTDIIEDRKELERLIRYFGRTPL